MAGFDSTEHQAVTRLFELARSGDTGNCEFGQLDSMIYERLVRNYAAMPERVILASTVSEQQTAA